MEVVHQFYNTNKFFPNWEVNYLFLGTFNPICGEQLDYFYRRKENGFWKILKQHFDPKNEYQIETFDGLKTFMIDKKIGCIDVISKVTFPDEKRYLICGTGYEDSKLFTVKNFIREYTFIDIQNFIVQNKTPKVFTTWGKRENPNEFKQQVDSFKNFCNNNNVCFTLLPSPSGRVYRGNKIPTINHQWINRINNNFCNQPL